MRESAGAAMERRHASKVMRAILGDHAAHKRPNVVNWLAGRPRRTFRFAPTSASSLNAVEGFRTGKYENKILIRRKIRRERRIALGIGGIGSARMTPAIP